VLSYGIPARAQARCSGLQVNMDPSALESAGQPILFFDPHFRISRLISQVLTQLLIRTLSRAIAVAPSTSGESKTWLHTRFGPLLAESATRPRSPFPITQGLPNDQTSPSPWCSSLSTPYLESRALRRVWDLRVCAHRRKLPWRHMRSLIDAAEGLRCEWPDRMQCFTFQTHGRLSGQKRHPGAGQGRSRKSHEEATDASQPHAERGSFKSQQIVAADPPVRAGGRQKT